MGARSGLALKTLQWFVRGVQFACAALILAIYSYFLATLHNHSLEIDTRVRAVEGISGAAVLYTGAGLLLLCCLAGHMFTSFLAILFDVAFCAAFIYVATANRGGASSCTGEVNTAFGSGNAETGRVDSGTDGFTALPSLKTACKLESACLAVSIVAIFFFIFSGLIEVALGRHRQKEKRFGPSPANDYTSGYPKKKGLFSFFGRKKRDSVLNDNPNTLPEHTHPDQVRNSYATEQTRVGTAHADQSLYPKYGEAGYGNQHTPAYPQRTGVTMGNADGVPTTTMPNSTASAHYPPANYQYDDGVYDARR